MLSADVFCQPCVNGPGSAPAVGASTKDDRPGKENTHGGTKARAKCKHPDGCERQAKKGGLCIAHGGTGKKCKHSDGCDKQAHRGGLCIAHGGTHVKAKCKHPDGCEKWQQKGGLCTRHFKAELAAQDPVGKQAQTMEAVTTLIGFRTMLS